MDEIFAALGFVAVGGGVVAVFAARHGRLAPRVALSAAGLVALASTAGSLYYSEIQNFVPCELCWYQRIAMYPLVVIIAVGLLRKDSKAAWYALPLAIAGLAVSVHHYRIQMFGGTDTCDISASCAFQWVDAFGFVSIPFMATTAFASITALSAASLCNPVTR